MPGSPPSGAKNSVVPNYVTESAYTEDIPSRNKVGDEQNRTRLAARGTVVYLHACPEELYLRVRHDKNRPLLATPDPRAKLEALYAERDPLYRQIADLVIETGTQSAQALARHLLARLEESWKLSA